MQYGRQQTRQVTGRQKRNGVIDIRGEVAILRIARHLLRERVPHYTQDRYFAPDIDNAIALLAARHLTRLLPAVLH